MIITTLFPVNPSTTNAAEAGHMVVRNVVSGFKVISLSNARVAPLLGQPA